VWRAYELPDPNLGNYSPTQVTIADSAPAILAQLGDANFDFRRNVVLTEGLEALTPARDLKLTIVRGGVRLSGASDGTSLVLLPQQFSHCLAASDPRVRIVRADLAWAALVFSGKVDTTVTLAYGLFSPRCRRADLADLKRLGVALPPAAKPPVERTWRAVLDRLGAAVAAVK